MSRILVTGGAGFIGSHLVDALLNRNEKVIVIDNLSMGDENNLPQDNNITFIKGDLSDPELVNTLFSKYTIKTIFHLGAVASVVASIEKPSETHRTNMDGTLILLEAAKKYGVGRFIFASSAAIFGDEPTLPKSEESTIKPLTPYAIDKYGSEQYVIAYNRLYHLPTTVLRFFNVFGNRQNPSSPYSGVVSILTDKFKKLKNNEEDSFILYGEGDQTRDFIHVKDVVKALILVMEREAAVGEIFNLGTGISTSLKQLIEIYERATGLSLPIIEKEERSGDIKYSYTSIEKIKAIGYTPDYSLEEGIKIYWDKECS
ncbi:NAD-dependent epimerase/dehydratase family protein [Bacillus sp. Marseille-Q1617]|uniref:NAD-dependent epimerase/dehydratase family protein n=1 Tax=Bacillus sp. Marseille-Q1617 TaxID=2736887 RepID=UPI00158EA421|nr:NAD-dependent epimerase/dehydratase family protein [Bacillus sp. Marseille-Q1617]